MQTLYTVKAELPLGDGRYVRTNYMFETMDERRAFVAGIAAMGGTVKKVIVEETKSADEALSALKAYLTKRGY